MAIIVDSVAATGKSTVGKRPNVLDMDSNRYKFYWDEHFAIPPKERPKIARSERVMNPNWWENYKNEIVKQSQNFDVIVIGLSIAVYENQTEWSEFLEANNLNYIMAIPEIDSMQEFLSEIEKRQRARGSTEEGITFVRENMPVWVDCMHKLDYPKITIRNGEFLEDALLREGLLS